jgi:hypothetical protein
VSATPTLIFYVQSDANDMAEVVWAAFDQKQNSTTKTVPFLENAEAEAVNPGGDECKNADFSQGKASVL